MPSQPILRFAPSPNGLLHLGHAYSALLNARLAQAMGGIMLLRIEDIDTARCRPEFVEAIFEDLHWLGLSWPEPVMRQSARFAVYGQAAQRLRDMGLLYPCFCSRSEIAARAQGTDPDGAPLYPGTCRTLSPDDAETRLQRGERHQWRLKMDEAAARTGALSYLEAEPDTSAGGGWGRAQSRRITSLRWGDVVLVRKDTPTSYHLSVVVDDAAQGVTHVVRGKDLQAATGVHVILQYLLGLPSPQYSHHDLIVDEEAQKLAKSRGSPSLRSLREAGWTAGDVRLRVGLA